MARVVACYTCNQKNYFNASWAGRVTTCQYCGRPVTVPADAIEVDAPHLVLPPAPPPASLPLVAAMPELSIWRILGTFLCTVLGAMTLVLPTILLLMGYQNWGAPYFRGGSADWAAALVVPVMYGISGLYFVCGLGVYQRYRLATWLAGAAALLQGVAMATMMWAAMDLLLPAELIPLPWRWE